LNQSTTYFDGLGRPIQSVTTQGSPDKQDLVQPIAYDAFGREPKKYLPYAAGTNGQYKADALTAQGSFYQNATGVAHDNHPFALTQFDASPLNRVLEQGAPGTAWQPKGGVDASGNTVKLLQRTNTANEVLRCDYRFATGRVSSAGSYEARQLLVSQTTDEHGLKMLEYRDKEGRVVAKKVQEVKDNESSYLTTAYVYDDLALQRLVIQPQGMANLAELSTHYDRFVSQWCYAYDYDARRRQVSKRVPGAEPVWMVYNRRDELVLNQDGNGRNGTTANAPTSGTSASTTPWDGW